MTSIQAGELHNHAQQHAGADPGEIIAIGLSQVVRVLVQVLVVAHALEWSRRPRRPIELARAGPRPRRRPGYQRWQAIFPALPRPGPGASPALLAARRVSA